MKTKTKPALSPTTGANQSAKSGPRTNKVEKPQSVSKAVSDPAIQPKLILPTEQAMDRGEGKTHPTFTPDPVETQKPPAPPPTLERPIERMEGEGNNPAMQQPDLTLPEESLNAPAKDEEPKAGASPREPDRPADGEQGSMISNKRNLR